MDQNLFSGLTEEQKEVLKKCKNMEEIMEFASNEGIELNEAQMAAINGGCGGPSGCTSNTIEMSDMFY